MTNQQLFVATLRVKINGSPIAETVMDNLYDLEVESTMYLPSMLTMKFHDPHFTLIDGTTFALGAAITIEIGQDSTTMVEVFNGEVVVQEPLFDEGFTASLTIRAFDKLHRLNRETKTRVLVQVSDSDAVTRICQEAGLTASVTATTVVHPTLWQDNVTNLAFIHMLARRNGYEVRYDGTTLHFKPPAANSSGVTATWGQNLRVFEPRLSLAQQVTSVEVKGWDPKAGQAIVGTSSSTTNDFTTGITSTGGAASQTAFGGPAKHVEPFIGVGTQSYAQKIALALHKDINANHLQAEGLMYGDGRLVAGKQLSIQSVGTRFSGTYRATTVIHKWGADGFDTRFRVEGLRPTDPGTLHASHDSRPGLMGSWLGVYPAVVTNIADPDNMMRVKLKFPWLDDTLETDWALVVLPVGVMSTPAVNSPVAVAFEQGNFDRPYVIGGLYNNNAQPPSTNTNAVASGKVIQQIVRTSKGHSMTFQDKQGEEKIAITSADSQMKVEMDITNKKVTVQSAQDVLVKATGNLNLEATGNVTMKGAAVTVESTGQMDLKATGIANLKGSMVNIN